LAFTPILIRLREILKLGNNLTETLENHLENWNFTKDSKWLTNKNQRFLFLLDGFDELLLEGRSTGGLKDFLEQVERFQANSHHRIIITGRPLAIQGLERSTFQRKGCIERAKILPMNDTLRNEWLKKWGVKFGEEKQTTFGQFLKACPDDIRNQLAREPLLLYVLGRIHREGEIEAANLGGTSAMAAKLKVYDRTVEWVLAKQRDNLNEKIFDFQLEFVELRQLLTEVSVCVIQSGNEIAKVKTIEDRLMNNTNDHLRDLFSKISETQAVDGKAMNNLLTTFYIQAAQKDRNGSIEFAHKSFGEFLFAERIKEAFLDWSSTRTNRRGQSEDEINKQQFESQIYDLLGSACLTPDIVSYLREMLASNADGWVAIRLFERLNEFWESWCEGEFIDRSPTDNLPQKKMQLLREQIPDREIILGIRQVDLHAGLNTLILLLELHRYSQNRDDLKGKIVFYPSGKSPDNKHTNRLLKVIHYSESIGIGSFNQNLRSFLGGADLRGANLRGADLRGADLSDANLSRADLRGADLKGADLRGANLGGANLSGADLNDANLNGANLSSAVLIGANLRGSHLKDADLNRADLIGANLGGANLSRANLSRANLSSADLSRANLSRANLSGANLSGANLNGAYFNGADLGGANLNGSDLGSAKLSGVNWNESTRLRGAIGLNTAIDVPPDLARYIGLDG
jgi:uncharacterized protein YjbI with pentapeptide repeats